MEFSPGSVKEIASCQHSHCFGFLSRFLEVKPLCIHLDLFNKVARFILKKEYLRIINLDNNPVIRSDGFELQTPRISTSAVVYFKVTETKQSAKCPVYV